MRNDGASLLPMVAMLQILWISRLLPILSTLSIAALLVTLGVLPRVSEASPPGGLVHTLEAGGPPSAVVDLVFVAEGYTTGQESVFLLDAQRIYSGLMQDGAYGQLRPLLAGHAQFVASAEAGSDHPSQGIERDTAFDSTFDSSGVGRLITANTGAILSSVNAGFPAFDVAILVVNDARYGGSGGSVPMVSVHPAAIAVLRHELAHNLAGLADEYTAAFPGYPTGDAEPNVTSAAHLDPLPWRAWVAAATPIPTQTAAATGPYTPIGAYEGARYLTKDMFRPSPTCLMRDLQAKFCPVCVEALILAVAAKSKTLRGASPAGSDVACVQGDCPAFTVTTVALADLVVRWRLDGVPSGEGLTWAPPGNLGVGLHTVVAQAQITSPAVRADPTQALIERRSWQLTVLPADLGADGNAHGGLDGGGSNDGAPNAGAPNAGGGDPSATGWGCSAGGSPLGGSWPSSPIWPLLVVWFCSVAALRSRRCPMASRGGGAHAIATQRIRRQGERR